MKRNQPKFLIEIVCGMYVCVCMNMCVCVQEANLNFTEKNENKEHIMKVCQRKKVTSKL